MMTIMLEPMKLRANLGAIRTDSLAFLQTRPDLQPATTPVGGPVRMVPDALWVPTDVMVRAADAGPGSLSHHSSLA